MANTYIMSSAGADRGLVSTNAGPASADGASVSQLPELAPGSH